MKNLVFIFLYYKSHLETYFSFVMISDHESSAVHNHSAAKW